MSLSIRHLLAFFLQLGFWGILVLAIADDSFLFLPIGSDLLTVILVARDHDRLPLYVLAAATGSTIGVFLLDLVCRKGGEEGLKRLVKPKLLDYLERRMKKHAAAALVVSCLAPPPFPLALSSQPRAHFSIRGRVFWFWSSWPVRFAFPWLAGRPSILGAGFCGSRAQASSSGLWAVS